MPLYSGSGYGSGQYGIQDGGPVFPLPISYYLNLFTNLYRLAPNLNAWMFKLLQPLDALNGATSSITAAFDLDTAVGVQLDTLGVILGQARQVGFQPSGGVSSILTDDVYRLLLRATIAQNQWDGTVSSLQPIWQTLFPGGSIRVIDNQNMSATIVLSGAFSSIAQDLITNGLIVPRPMGVEYTYTFGDLPIFGYDEVNGFIAGYDLGHWS